MTEETLPTAIQRAHGLVLASYTGLLIYFAVNSLLVLGGLRLATPVIWLIQTAPLLIFAHGLFTRRLRSHAWLSFVVLLYFTHGVLIAFDPDRRWLGLTESVLCVALFCSLVWYIRGYRNHFGVGV